MATTRDGRAYLRRFRFESRWIGLLEDRGEAGASRTAPHFRPAYGFLSESIFAMASMAAWLR